LRRDDPDRLDGRLLAARLIRRAILLRSIAEQFHELYYESRVWLNTFWLGVETQKCPLDLWIYQEILFSQRPSLIVECGTARGGSALFLASICDQLDRGRVLTIDIDERAERPAHPRIKYLTGSSTSAEIVERVKAEIAHEDETMVILDSDHGRDHVLAELRIYSELVSVGNYLIVEDTNVNGHPVEQHFGSGPMEAVETFLHENKSFVVDQEREKFFLTFNPKGYLRRINRATSTIDSRELD
jgi:cephalosporin hydroxylase